MEGGIDDVGLGVLYGLNNYPYDFVGQLMHAEHLEAYMGVGPHTISVPRIRPADDIDPDEFENGVPDEIFEDIIALIRVAVPYTGMIISTRESQEMRRKALELGVSQISGGSKTSVGGYDESRGEDNSAQFDTDDSRSLDEVIHWLLDLGYLPSFCTACYRAGRTGETFMEEVKSFQIAKFCQPNAIMTLQEYLSDYAAADTRKLGEEKIHDFLKDVERDNLREKAAEYVKRIQGGERDFRF